MELMIELIRLGLWVGLLLANPPPRPLPPPGPGPGPRIRPAREGKAEGRRGAGRARQTGRTPLGALPPPGPPSAHPPPPRPHDRPLLRAAVPRPPAGAVSAVGAGAHGGADRRAAPDAPPALAGRRRRLPAHRRAGSDRDTALPGAVRARGAGPSPAGRDDGDRSGTDRPAGDAADGARPLPAGTDAGGLRHYAGVGAQPVAGGERGDPAAPGGGGERLRPGAADDAGPRRRLLGAGAVRPPPRAGAGAHGGLRLPRTLPARGGRHRVGRLPARAATDPARRGLAQARRRSRNEATISQAPMPTRANGQSRKSQS